MASITTQNIASASSQVRPTEGTLASSQDSSRNGVRNQSETANASRLGAENSTVSPDGGSSSRATEANERVTSPFAPEPREDSQENQAPGRPSSEGTGRFVDLVA